MIRYNWDEIKGLIYMYNTPKMGQTAIRSIKDPQEDDFPNTPPIAMILLRKTDNYDLKVKGSLNYNLSENDDFCNGYDNVQFDIPKENIIGIYIMKNDMFASIDLIDEQEDLVIDIAEFNDKESYCSILNEIARS